MRLVRFNGGRIGAIKDSAIHDLTEAAGVDPQFWPPVGMLRLIRDFTALRPKLEAAMKGTGIPLASAQLETPIVWPDKLLAYPVNYTAHGVEMSSQSRADKNGFFLKTPTSLSGPNDAIVLPDLPGREVHHECELAVIVGKTARHVTPEEAMSCVFGYACLIDVTVRGKQERVMRKSFDTFTPIGPAIVTADEIPDPGNLSLKLWVNDKVRQDASTKDLIVDIPNMISLAASVTTLQPGDVIATGTPAGVGPINAGDTVTIEIEKVGRMSIPVVQGQGGNNIAFRMEEKTK